MSVFSDNLKELCNKIGISQDDFALLLGKTRGTVSNYQLGKSEPTFEDLVKIADYFRVSTDWLLGRPGAEKHFSTEPLKDEDQILLEQFKKRSEAILKEKGNLSEEKLRFTLDFMEFTFKQDLQREKNEGK